MTNDTDLNPYPTAESIREHAEIDPAFRAGVEAVLAQLDGLRDEWLAEPVSSGLLHHQAAMRLMHLRHALH